MIGTPEENCVDRRLLVVNADDFGLSERTNEGILIAHAQGIVTSTSVMVRKSAAIGAVRVGAMYPELSLGLHLDVGEWTYSDAKWHARYQVVPLDDTRALHREVSLQLDTFRAMLNCEPSHVDSHQHAHSREPLRSVVEEIFLPLGIPVRQFCPAIRYTGRFYGQSGYGEPLPETIRPSALVDVVRELPPGITELSCHPGLDDRLESPYCSERLVEIDTLCHPGVRQALQREGVRLVSFRQVRELIESGNARERGRATTNRPSTAEAAR